MQISAPVQFGNSGGPLLDRSGNVLGVVQSKLMVCWFPSKSVISLKTSASRFVCAERSNKVPSFRDSTNVQEMRHSDGGVCRNASVSESVNRGGLRIAMVRTSEFRISPDEAFPVSSLDQVLYHCVAQRPFSLEIPHPDPDLRLEPLGLVCSP